MPTSWPGRPLEVRGWLVVVGGFLVHISLGTIYTVGKRDMDFAVRVQRREKGGGIVCGGFECKMSL